MKVNLILKNIFIPICISLGIVTLLEIYLKTFGGYDTSITGNTKCKIYLPEKNFSIYKPNCSLTEKHWENNKTINYQINENGRRESNKYVSGNEKKIASVGDSFTFGAMVSIEDNYNFYGLNNLAEEKYIVHNYGVSGEGLENIFNKINTLELSQYEFILYGLTPNDFYEYLLETQTTKETNKIKNNKLILNNFDNLKKLILSTSLSRFLVHKALSNDENYYFIYLKRKPFSEYLNSKIGTNWSNAIYILEKKLANLSPEIKGKLKIYILPQRAEIVAKRLGKYNEAFINNILEVCRREDIQCKRPNIENLAKLKESHFPFDGHLTKEGNHSIAKDLAEWSKNW